MGPLGNCKEVALGQVVLAPKVAVREDLALVERVLLRKQTAWQGAVVVSLRRVYKVRHHVGGLGLVGAQSALELVFENEGHFTAGRVHQNLVHHVVGGL